MKSNSDIACIDSSSVGDSFHSCSFANETDRLGEMLCQSFDDIKTVSAAMLEKKRVICRIYNEQIAVSSKTIKFYQTWRCRNFGRDRNKTFKMFVIFKEMEAHLEPLNKFIEEFDVELKRAAEVMKRFDLCILAHLITLLQSFSILTKAKSMEDLKKVQIPSLDWMEIFDDPEIEELAEIWDEMRLPTTLDGFLRKSQCVLNRH